MNKKNTKSFSQKGIFPHKWAFTLLIPLRNVFLSPRKLIKRLALKKNSHVLEVGPGPGYFSPHIAKEVPEGKLVLSDIQQEMLEIAKKRMKKYNFQNVEYRLCDGEGFSFQNESFDLIFLVTVIGEVENKKAYIKDFYRILRSEGVVSVSELWGDPDKMSEKEIITLFEKEGFVLSGKYGNFTNCTLNFKKFP